MYLKKFPDAIQIPGAQRNIIIMKFNSRYMSFLMGSFYLPLIAFPKEGRIPATVDI